MALCGERRIPRKAGGESCSGCRVKVRHQQAMPGNEVEFLRQFLAWRGFFLNICKNLSCIGTGVYRIRKVFFRMARYFITPLMGTFLRVFLCENIIKEIFPAGVFYFAVWRLVFCPQKRGHSACFLVFFARFAFIASVVKLESELNFRVVADVESVVGGIHVHARHVEV